LRPPSSPPLFKISPQAAARWRATVSKASSRTRTCPALEFLQQDDGDNFVFNFAVARCAPARQDAWRTGHERAPFFRLLNAQSTSTDFDPSTTYRIASDGVLNGHKIALLGVRDNEYITIPCFASPRVNLTARADMGTQNDPPNAQTILVNPGAEVDTFLAAGSTSTAAAVVSSEHASCWQSGWAVDRHYAVIDQPGDHKAPHQCLVAEISYDDTPIPLGADAGTSDKLRNGTSRDRRTNPGLAGRVACRILRDQADSACGDYP